MHIFTTTLPSLPNWRVKIRTTVYNGKHLAIVSLPTDTGMLTINKEHASEHRAIHLAIDAIEELVNRVQYPHGNRPN